MGRERYRSRVQILRRSGATGGGYVPETYTVIAETSCEVRDESEAEYAAAESASIQHVKTFAMRARDIRDDDVLRYAGEDYDVRRVDRYTHDGREIRVRASRSTSRYSVEG